MSIKESLVQAQKLFIGNILIIFIVLIRYLLIVNMLLFLPVDLSKISFFFKLMQVMACNVVLTPQHTHMSMHQQKYPSPQKRNSRSPIWNFYPLQNPLLRSPTVWKFFKPPLCAPLFLLSCRQNYQNVNLTYKVLIKSNFKQNKKQNEIRKK